MSGDDAVPHASVRGQPAPLSRWPLTVGDPIREDTMKLRIGLMAMAVMLCGLVAGSASHPTWSRSPT